MDRQGRRGCYHSQRECVGDVTRILTAIEQGEPRAAEDLLPLVYDELRKLASHRIAREQPDHTLQPTALVHEAYLRLVDVEKARHWESRHRLPANAETPRGHSRRRRSRPAGAVPRDALSG